jgi:ABC-2 type transport system permease protein
VNRDVITAIARRDLLTVRRNTGVFVPMIIVPVVLVLVLPSAAFAVSRVDEQLSAFDRILRLLPADVVDALPPDPGARLAVILATYVLPPLLLIIPLMVASVMATDSIAGERERDTFEGLLLAPVSDREIVAGKLLGALVPAFAVGLGSAALYACVVDALFWSVADGPILPTRTWLLTQLWMGPAFTTAALGLTVVISARAQSAQSASQVAGLAVLPLVLLTIGQLSGVVLVVWWVTLPLGAVLWLAAFVLVRLGARRLGSDRLLSSV